MNSQILLVLLCLIAGILARYSQWFSKDTSKVLNAFVIWISLPSLVFVQVTKLLNAGPLTWDLLIPVSMAWILFLLSAATFYLVGRKLKWPHKQTGALVLLAGLGNTSFVGFPILESILGPHALPIGILVDQMGSFLVLATLGVFLASILSPHRSGRLSFQRVLRQVFTFPPFVSLLLTFGFWLAGMKTENATPILERLANTLIPIALVSVGFQIQLSFAVLKKHWQPVCLGLGFKLILAPAFFYFLYVVVLGSNSFSTQVTVLEAAMASMITAGVVAEEFGFDNQIVSLMLGLSIPISIFTVPIWNQLLF